MIMNCQRYIAQTDSPPLYKLIIIVANMSSKIEYKNDDSAG